MKVNRLDRALDAANALLALGFRPYLVLAELKGRQKDFVGQMRSLNRALDDGLDFPLDPNQPWNRTLGKDAIEALRTGLLEEIGADYFINALVRTKQPSLNQNDDKAARVLAGRLEKADRAERAEIMGALRRYGRGVVPLVADHLASSDEDLRGRVRTLLQEWAEPR